MYLQLLLFSCPLSPHRLGLRKQQSLVLGQEGPSQPLDLTWEKPLLCHCGAAPLPCVWMSTAIASWALWQYLFNGLLEFLYYKIHVASSSQQFFYCSVLSSLLCFILSILFPACISLLLYGALSQTQYLLPPHHHHTVFLCSTLVLKGPHPCILYSLSILNVPLSSDLILSPSQSQIQGLGPAESLKRPRNDRIMRQSLSSNDKCLLSKNTIWYMMDTEKLQRRWFCVKEHLLCKQKDLSSNPHHPL